jgi:hypothetical protein
VCVCVCLCVCLSVFVFVFVCVFVCLFVCVCVSVCLSVCICVCVCLFVCIYIRRSKTNILNVNSSRITTIQNYASMNKTSRLSFKFYVPNVCNCTTTDLFVWCETVRTISL